MSEDQRIFLGLGSNIGDRYQILKNGIISLNDHPHIWVTDKSHVYQSPAMYNTELDDVYNMVIEIDTNLIPVELLNEIKNIETKTGRQQERVKNMPRILDIDILAIGDLQIHSGLLEIPHGGVSERKFVLKPWNDIAPEFKVPGQNATVSNILENTDDDSDVSMVLIFDEEEMI